MMKNFPKKKMNNFLRQKQTKDFIKVLKEKYSKLDTLKSVTVVKQGGTGQGTWMHRILALKFAAWLSPEFELFVFEVFDNYLQKQINEARSMIDSEVASRVKVQEQMNKLHNDFDNYMDFNTGFH